MNLHNCLIVEPPTCEVSKAAREDFFEKCKKVTQDYVLATDLDTLCKDGWLWADIFHKNDLENPAPLADDEYQDDVKYLYFTYDQLIESNPDLTNHPAFKHFSDSSQYMFSVGYESLVVCHLTTQQCGDEYVIQPIEITDVSLCLLLKS